MLIIRGVSADVADGRPLLKDTSAHAIIAGQVAACLLGDVDF